MTGSLEVSVGSRAGGAQLAPDAESASQRPRVTFAGPRSGQGEAAPKRLVGRVPTNGGRRRDRRGAARHISSPGDLEPAVDRGLIHPGRVSSAV